MNNEANKLRHTTRLLTRASIALKESVAYRMDDQPKVEQLILDINANLQYKDCQCNWEVEDDAASLFTGKCLKIFNHDCMLALGLCPVCRGDYRGGKIVEAPTDVSDD